MTFSATGRQWSGLAGLVALLMAVGVAGGDAAPKPVAPKASSPFQGFSATDDKPVNIRSDSIEVHQEQQKAIFSGHVVAVQGDSTLRAPTLVVFYEQTGQTAASVNASPGGAIKRLEAYGGVTIISKDQRATGGRAVFDMKANTATLYGHVVMIQGDNVVRGSTLVVNLTTGLARVLGGTTGRLVPADDKAPRPQ